MHTSLHPPPRKSSLRRRRRHKASWRRHVFASARRRNWLGGSLSPHRAFELAFGHINQCVAIDRPVDVTEFTAICRHSQRRHAGVSAKNATSDQQAAGWREGNPALDAIRLLRERRDPIVLPDEASIQAVFGECSPALRKLAVAARLTGARQAELNALKWSQFNAEAGRSKSKGQG